MDWELSQKKYSLARMDYEAQIANMQDSINSLECGVTLQIKGGQKGTIAELHKRFAMKHGRKYTGRKRGGAKKACRCGWSTHRSQATGWKGGRGRGGRRVAGIFLECHR
jgi:hypothetical protein